MGWKMDPKDIRIGRLEKKIRKLTKQRDFHKERHEHYAKVISLQPYLERRWEGFEQEKRKQEFHKTLLKRCEEQEQLIRLLTKDEMDK